MFIHDSHLPNILPAEMYTSQAHFEREIERLFLPNWHCVAVASDLPREGDFVTFELFGHPIILWNRGGEYRAYLNVCSHRHCTLTDKSCGKMRGNLKCQYHGWEYDQTGNTRKIPDAKSFRPLKPGILGLTTFRTQTAGQTIWITCNENAPDLRDYLGPIYQRCEEMFSPEHRTVITDRNFGRLVEHECNWKVIMENILESYHIECLHPRTFQRYPVEEQMVHRFYDLWDWLEVNYQDEPRRLEAFASWLVGRKPQYTWHHLCRYPSVVFGTLAIFNFVQTVIPISPTCARLFTRVMVFPGKKGRFGSRVIFRGLKLWSRLWFPTVNAEDAGIYPSVQRGLNSRILPKGGLVSRREERIFPFQKYVLEMTGDDPPANLAPCPANRESLATLANNSHAALNIN